jgi:phosphoribosylamine--glycine ligase
LIIHDLAEAKEELRNMLVHQKFGAASTKVVIEEFLDGIELSFVTDGKSYKYFQQKITNALAKATLD